MDDIVQIVERGEAAMAREYFPLPDGDLENTYQNAQTQAAAEGAAETGSSNDWINGQTDITKPVPNGAQTGQTGTEFPATVPQITTSSEQPPSVTNQPFGISSSDTQLASTSEQPLTSIYSPEPTAETSTHSSITTSSSSSSTSSSTTSTSTTRLTSATSTAQSTATEAPDNTNTGASNSLSSTKTKLAIALPITIVGLLIIGALIFFFLRRRKRRNTAPAYDIATGQQRGISTSELMTVQNVETSNPGMSSISHLPGSATNVSNRGLDRDLDPGSVRSCINDSHTELGLAITAPMDQGRSASQQDSPRFSGGASRTSTPRMPFERRDGEEDDDDISIVSGTDRRNRERDFDDMSSVSSFEDNMDEHRRSGNGNGNSR